MKEEGGVPKIVLETSSLQVIKQTARSKLGVCLLLEMAVKNEVEKEELVKIRYLAD